MLVCSRSMTSPLADLEDQLRQIAAPLIARDGGRLYLVRLTEEEISLHLAGRYAGSPGAELILHEIILPLVHSVCPNTRVLMTSGWALPPGALPLST
jgi:hypothetical protein